MHQSQSQAARYGQGAAQQAAYTRGKRGRIRAARAAQPALDRRTGLCRLLPLWPRELDDQSLQGRRHIVERLRKALRAERRRGIAGHWTYDLARHVELLRLYRAELAALPEDARQQVLQRDEPGSRRR